MMPFLFVLIWAYPRACGATPSEYASCPPGRGLSPRVRGNRLDKVGTAAHIGPIPARAGQPEGVALRLHDIGAYPRACGATRHSLSPAAQARGLSPRVRGNQVGMRHGALAVGPIPARAGQPEARRWAARAAWAYPRACGATAIVARRGTGRTCLSPRVRGNRPQAFLMVSVLGLSPRVRGNRKQGTPWRGLCGPIPARAGQPPPRS